jgi:hypothetical protein
MMFIACGASLLRESWCSLWLCGEAESPRHNGFKQTLLGADVFGGQGVEARVAA